ncbi:2-dehydropantoate 2-reductase [Bacillus sp. AFS076308]|uniref:ketopantoate reductase family protein n=1 Tax=unclassified Bacillus (in: firmicutes) TaxID=185979 RepID=UPI000BF34784|nr:MULTISPECIES: 2-dehydropantoate 2-reductase [unclassified Bacillus (in: firmicutes)]PFO08650.1 2-dehydropantoate 2-reductase [Bacillus sp. AFS076308]PGV49925.1 2-dehydropantoate 2-reductase [Bacillus sp. AFS037270]
MVIKKVSIIGLGALGILFGNQFSKRLPRADLRIIADQDRIQCYKEVGVFCNGERCDFNYVRPHEACEPADLLIIAVKFNGLADAIQAVKHHVGERTIILSLLNGITSEEIIGEAYGMDKVLYCVAQGMDAVKVENQLTYDHMGMICFGGTETEKVNSLAEFFEQVEIPYEVDPDMLRRLWGKFMLNVGVNQTVAVFESNYGEVQLEGPARTMMISAMREVMALSEKVEVPLTEEDLDYWLRVLGKLSPDGKPSMAQDVEARRFSEVELFSGTVVKLGKRYDVPTPVNQELYHRIKSIENQYTMA